MYGEQVCTEWLIFLRAMHALALLESTVGRIEDDRYAVMDRFE